MLSAAGAARASPEYATTRVTVGDRTILVSNEAVLQGTATCKRMKFHAVHRDGMVLRIAASTATVLLKGRPRRDAAAPERETWNLALQALSVAASKQRRREPAPKAVQSQWAQVLAECHSNSSDSESSEDSGGDAAEDSDATSATPEAVARSSGGAAPRGEQAAPAPSDVLSQPAAVGATPAELQATAQLASLSEQLAAALQRIQLMEAKMDAAPDAAPAPAEQTAPAAAHTARAAAQASRRAQPASRSKPSKPSDEREQENAADEWQRTECERRGSLVRLKGLRPKASVLVGR
jgi:hypothetical protein